MRDRRIGKFSLSSQILEDSPGMVRELMSRCIIINCEFEYHNDSFSYTAISPEFVECPIGGIPLHYEIIIDEIAQQAKFK